jgi:hypothetical protein
VLIGGDDPALGGEQQLERAELLGPELEEPATPVRAEPSDEVLDHKHPPIA